MRILIIEDDQRIASNLQRMLGKESFSCDIADTVDSARQKVEMQDYDLLILDWLLPDGEGVDLCEQLRSEGKKVAILLLTARGQLADRVQGLNSGADDYLCKPFQFSELVARVRALLRRKDQVFLDTVMNFGEVAIDTNLCKVTVKGKIIDLSPKEFALLEYLGRNQGRVVPKQELFEHVWDEQADFWQNSLEVHVSTLRKKLAAEAVEDLIQTVKGKGYLCGH